MNKKVRLNASETEWIRPFTTVEEALENCKFRLNEVTEFSPESRFEWEDEDKIEPEVLLSISSEEVSKLSNVEQKNLVISVIVRDRNLRISKNCVSLPIMEVNETVVDLANYFPNSPINARFEVAILISQKVDDSHLFTYPRLGQKIFVIDTIKNKSAFPKEWKNPEDFEAIGLPKTTPWFLEWRSEDLDSELKDMFALWLNLKYQTQFNRLGLSSKYDLSQSQMTANIMAVVMVNIFKKAYDQGKLDQGASGDLIKKLKNSIGVQADDVRSIINSPNYYSTISSWSLEMMEIGKTLESIDE